MRDALAKPWRPFLTPSFLRLLAVAFGWTLLMRAVLLVHSGLLMSPIWSVAGDMVGAFVLALLLCQLQGVWTRRALILALALAFYSCGNHLATHGTLVRLAHAGHATDPVFLSSSVLDLQLLLFPLYLALCWLLSYTQRRFAPIMRLSVSRSVLAGAVVLLVYAPSVPSLTMPSVNVVASLLAQAPGVFSSAPPPRGRDDITPVVVEDRHDFFNQQVRGDPPDLQPNILLIMVEGLSAAYLPSVASYHGLEPAVALPTLDDALTNGGFRVYRNMLSMQRKTDRGTYPLLCGEYPRLVTQQSKMTEIALGAESPNCLPELLAHRGYRTGYLQAAPLEFMHKDSFMPGIGFDRVDGARYFAPIEEIEGWGPPDDVFYQGAMQWLQAIDGGMGPWFATMLNVGTHHPFPEATDGADSANADEADANDNDSPSILAPSERQAQRQAAFDTLSRSLIEFLQALRGSGMLERTLVVITSDESGGHLRRQQEAQPLDNNAGFLAIRPPSALSLVEFADRDTIVASLDIPLTLLDLVGGQIQERMIGRSLLVRNGRPRDLLLGDTYAGHTLFLLEAGELMACNESLVNCQSWTFEPGRLFGSLTPGENPPTLEPDYRRHLVERAGIIGKPTPSDPATGVEP